MTLAYQLHNIDYAYGEEAVLCIDEYTIAADSIVAVAGANGSGKSTLLNLLAFITLPSHGELCFYGENLSGGKVTAFRLRTAYVQQKPYLFNFSVMRNIELGLKLRGMDKLSRRKRVEALASKLNLRGLLQKRAHELSGGEIQKVAIARALVLKPRVLLLDEPFTYLDRESKADMETLLSDMSEAGCRNIIFSTHDHLQAQNLADHVCNLEKGRIIPWLPINTFKGHADTAKGIFDTGKVKIQIPSTVKGGTLISVESTHLVLSRDRLQSSMRNQFKGRVKSLHEDNGEIHVAVEAGESWHVIITHAALSELDMNVGEHIWLSFKSSAVRIY